MNAIQNILQKSASSGSPASNTGASGTSGTSATSATPGAGTDATSAAQAAKDASDRFLTLLVAQLQNQDPLNPMDNAQVTTQLAQISTVNGINQLNDTVAALSASMGITQSLQAASLVGRDVVVGGSAVDLAGGKAQAGLALASDADSVTVTIADAAGNVVRTLDLGAQKAGSQMFDWDGKTDSGTSAADGHYTYTATATANGKAVTFDPLMVAHVEGVATTPGGVMLQLPYAGQVALDQVRQIH
jgi:flagellar basal-body rod modification protein FlgD